MSCLEKSYVKEKFKEFCMWIKKGLKNNINNIVFYLSSTKIKVKENTNYKSHNVHTQFTLTRSLARVFKPIFVTFASSFYSSFIFFLFLRAISLLPIKCFSSVFFKSSSKWQVASQLFLNHRKKCHVRIFQRRSQQEHMCKVTSKCYA